MTLQDLSKGALTALVSGRKCDDTFQPVFQVLDVRAAKSGPSRYQLVLSDGSHYASAMIMASHNNLVTSGKLAEKCLIKCQNAAIKVASNSNTAAKVWIIVCVKLSVVHAPVPAELGTPQPIAIQPPQQQQQQQPQQSQSRFGGNNPQQQQSQSRFGGNNPQRSPFGQQSNSNFSGYNRPSSAGGGINALNVVPVGSLNPYRTKWTIRVRVTAKSDIRRWKNANGEGKLFSVDLLDKSGDEIRATMFKEQVDKFEDVLQVNQVYLIQGGRVKPANKRFSALKNEYEVTFDHTTHIECVNDDAQIKTQQYEFVNIGDLPQRPENTHVDILAVVKNIDEISIIQSQKTNKELKKRTLLLADKTGEIQMTLWSGAAEKYNEEVLKGNPVVCVKNARVSDFGGRSLSMTGSTMELNADMQEVFHLTAWWTNGGQQANLPSMSSGYSGNQGIGEDDKWLFMCQVKDQQLGGDNQQPDFFVCKGTITTIRSDMDKPPYYMACTNKRPNGHTCNKKVDDHNPAGAHCETCNRSTEAIARYVLGFSVNDHTGNQYFSAFDDIGKKLLGTEAEAMRQFRLDNNEAAFGAVTKDALFQMKLFKCRAKMETYNDEQRLKCTVVYMDDFDYVAESKKLIEYLEQSQEPQQQQGVANMVG